MSRDTWLTLLIGPVFAILLVWKFPGSASFPVALGVGLVLALAVLGLRRGVGTHTTARFLLVVTVYGLLLGAALWLLVARALPWYLLVLPCAVFTLVAGVLERLSEKWGRSRQAAPDR